MTTINIDDYIKDLKNVYKFDYKNPDYLERWNALHSNEHIMYTYENNFNSCIHNLRLSDHGADIITNIKCDSDLYFDGEKINCNVSNLTLPLKCIPFHTPLLHLKQSRISYDVFTLSPDLSKKITNVEYVINNEGLIFSQGSYGFIAD